MLFVVRGEGGEEILASAGVGGRGFQDRDILSPQVLQFSPFFRISERFLLSGFPDG